MIDNGFLAIYFQITGKAVLKLLPDFKNKNKPIYFFLLLAKQIADF